MATDALPLLADDVLVKVGGGSKAHVFRSRPGANMKRFELLEEGTVFDIALCGSRGTLVQAPDGADLCSSCRSQLDAEE